MEWLLAGIFALLMLTWSIAYLARKLLRLRPLVLPFTKQLELLAEAKQQAPDIAKLASALGDDPVIHVAKRLELQKKARKLKRERSRRLRSRSFR
jgi:hypothetical protein